MSYYDLRLFDSNTIHERGLVVGYCSTWTREPDSYGDVVRRGAFSDYLKYMQRERIVIPFLFNHDSGNIKSYIGTVTHLEEDDHGLSFEAVFDATEEAQRARELLKSKRITGFSFAYDILDSERITLPDGRKARELRKLTLLEISMTKYPANRTVSVVDIKRQMLLSEANELLNDTKKKPDKRKVKRLLVEADKLLRK